MIVIRKVCLAFKNDPQMSVAMVGNAIVGLETGLISIFALNWYYSYANEGIITKTEAEHLYEV